MAIRVTVNKVKCQSDRRCVAVAPAMFGIGADGKAQVIPGSQWGREIALQAARSCPYRAITVADADSGEQLFPPLRKTASQSG
jgi:ferredoxin